MRLEGCPERPRSHQVKQHAVHDRRRCGLNSMFKALRDMVSVSQSIRPKRSVNVHNASYWEDGERPKLLVVWKATERISPIFGGRSAPPPCTGRGQDETGSTELTVEISPGRGTLGWGCLNRIPENHKGAGAEGEVRVAHSSQRTGKPSTGRRGRQVQRSLRRRAR